MADLLQRPDGSGRPVKAADIFSLAKDARTAVCELWSHQLGWELRLLVAGDLRRSQVCRSGEEWLKVRDDWHTKLLETGWAAGVQRMPDASETLQLRIIRAGLPPAERITFARRGGSVAIEFVIGGITETVEGLGATDVEQVDDVIQQLPEVLKQRRPQPAQ